MSVQEGAVEQIRSFVERTRSNDEQKDRSSNLTEKENYEGRLDSALKGLQNQVKQQESDLQKLRASKGVQPALEPSSDHHQRLAQIRHVKRAYDSLLVSEPYLPSPDSPLPALLALQSTDRLIRESQVSIAQTKDDLLSYRKRLENEESNLHDANLITLSLENRIERLQQQRLVEADKTPAQVAEDLIRQRRKRKVDLEKDTKRLKKALDDFVDHQLAAMLVAEDLGGPIVGDLVNVPDEELEAGYTQHGKIKKKATKTSSEGDGKQQRIDQILRSTGRSGHDNSTSSNNKKEDAASEMQALIEELLDASGDGTGSGAYIQLQRDSPAARFLVRAKIAQFHPRDARRLRLIDFGREIDD